MTDIPRDPERRPPASSGRDESEPEPLYGGTEGAEPIADDEVLPLEADLHLDEADLAAWPPVGADAGSADVEPEPELDQTETVPSAGAPAQRPAGRRLRPQAAPELHQLWGSVFFAVERPPPKLVVVTSALRREGVTQIATALAMSGSAAHADLRIALLDCNLRHPRVAELLGLPESPGLCDILTGRASLDSCLIELTLENSGRSLYAVVAGSPDDQPLGLLRSRQFKGLLATLGDRFDHVVIDAPAANLYPDPQVIGALVDGALLVVRAGQTRRETVGEAKKRLDLAQVKLLGVVLNQRTYPIPGFIYRNL